MKPILSRWLPLLIWALLIFLTSANQYPYRLLPASWETAPPVLPGPPAVGSQGISRVEPEILGRYLHVGEYLVLAVLIARALVWEKSLHISLLTRAFGLSAFCALLDEIHQYLVPRRTFQLLDLALDIFGAIIGLGLYSFFQRLNEKPSQVLPE